MKEKPYLFYNVSVVVASDMVLVLQVFSVHNTDEDSSKMVVVVVVAKLAGSTVVVVVVVVVVVKEEEEGEDMDTLQYTPMMGTKDQDHYCIVLVVEIDD